MKIGDRVRIKKCRIGTIAKFRDDGFIGVKVDALDGQIVFFRAENLAVIKEAEEVS